MKLYTREEAEALVYELLAVSILKALPEDKLLALDEAISGTDEAFNTFLYKEVPNIEELLRGVCSTLALPEGVC